MFLAVKSIFVQAEFQKAFKNCEVCILVLSYSQRDLVVILINKLQIVMC